MNPRVELELGLQSIPHELVGRQIAALIVLSHLAELLDVKKGLELSLREFAVRTRVNSPAAERGQLEYLGVTSALRQSEVPRRRREVKVVAGLATDTERSGHLARSPRISRVMGLDRGRDPESVLKRLTRVGVARLLSRRGRGLRLLPID